MGVFGRVLRVFAPSKKPKIGLALGSGGAKGMAHLGMLKAFEEHGIAFDVVTGTSIGSIVGALYAKRYSAADMTEIVRALNMKEFSRNLRPFAEMDFVEEFLLGYVDGDFSSLSLPFAAWATDAQTNEGVLLNSGSVARACTASAAIPPFFRAVEVDGRRLADGAYTNSIPADVCKDMGAEFVIGCDLSAYLKPEEERSAMSRLIGTAINAFVTLKYSENSKSRGYNASDIMLRPNLIEYRATDASRIALEEMYEIGYEETTSRMSEILDGLKKIGYKTK